jgi:hypothetical protein
MQTVRGFIVLLIVHTGIHVIFANNQLDELFFFTRTFIFILYMFRAAMCPSSGELVVSIRHLVYVTLCRWCACLNSFILTFTPDGHLHTVAYNRCRVDTINSPDDGHIVARNMYRIDINIYEKRIVRQVCYLQRATSLFIFSYRIFDLIG